MLARFANLPEGVTPGSRLFRRVHRVFCNLIGVGIGFFHGRFVCPGVGFPHLPDGFAPAPRFDPFKNIRKTMSSQSVIPAAAHIEMTMACQFHELAPGSSEPFAPSVSSLEVSCSWNF